MFTPLLVLSPTSKEVGIERELLPVNRFKFLGRETQAETGWVDLMQRMYEPPLGRFTSVDPVTASQESLSTYQYGWNNPVLRSDRNGDCPNCGDGEHSHTSNSQLSTALSGQLDYSAALSNLAEQALTFTDINDASVIATNITRKGNPINLDGTSASGGETFAAHLGAFLPIVSGSAVKKGVEFIGSAAIGAYKDLVGKYQQAHHIIQNAAVDGVQTVTKRSAPAVHLQGKANVVGTEHYKATQEQIKRRVLGDGGTYRAERGVAYRALRAAGKPIDESKQIVRKADSYFMQQKGFSLTTPTKKVKVN